MESPTRRQLLLASDRLPLIWMLSFAAVAVVWAVLRLNVRPAGFVDVYAILWLIAVVVLSFLAGWFASIIPAWLIFGPILMEQGEKNGGPFVIGDRVELLCGPHRGVITTVYGKAQYDASRIDIGEQARENFTDIFGDYQLLRRDEVNQSGSADRDAGDNRL